MKDFERPLTAMKDYQRPWKTANDWQWFPKTQKLEWPRKTVNNIQRQVTTIWKPGLTIEEMECKFGCHERGKSSTRLFAKAHRTEAETKSDIQVENLINFAELKANFMGKLYYY